MGGRQKIDWREETKIFTYSLPAGHELAVAVLFYRVTAPVGLSLPYGSVVATATAITTTLSRFWQFSLLVPWGLASECFAISYWFFLVLFYASVNNPLVSPRLPVSYPDWYIYHVPPSGLTVSLWMPHLVAAVVLCTGCLAEGHVGVEIQLPPFYSVVVDLWVQLLHTEGKNSVTKKPHAGWQCPQ